MIHSLRDWLVALDEFEIDPGNNSGTPSGDAVAWLDEFMKILPYVALVLALVAVIVVLFIAYKYKTTKIQPMSEEAIQYCLEHLGGMDNIILADHDGARIRFQVKQVSKCDLVAIKDLGALGIFVSGNNIKMMFPFDAMALLTTIQTAKREGL